MRKNISRFVAVLICTIAIWMGMSYSGYVQAAPPRQGPGLTPAEMTALLEAHNSWRLRFSVPELVWDPTVAAVAQDWANQVATTGTFAHRPNNQFGENIWGGTSGFFVPSDAVNSWGSESADYDFATNTCAAGKTCGHFTQLVWARSLKVGCGKATGQGNDYYVCNYDPPGNFAGQTTGASPAAALTTVRPTNVPAVATQATATTGAGAAAQATATQAPIKGTTGLNTANATELLNATNAVRAKFNVPPLVWDDTVATFAQEWSDQIAAAGGTFVSRANSPYGVNFFFGTTGGEPSAAVDWWDNGAADFNLTTNTCAAGKNCSAFTQLVWSKTTKLGCGRTSANGNDYYICNYDPRGNVAGEVTGASVASGAPAGAGTGTQTPTLAPTATAAATLAATSVVTATAATTGTVSATITPTATVTGTVGATITPTLTVTTTGTVTATITVTSTNAVTGTVSATLTPTAAATLAATKGLSADEVTALLNAHNSWRTRFNVPPVTWAAGVAGVAQDWADHLAATNTFEHRQNNQFGENIWGGSSGFFIVTDAVNSWGSEVDNYDFAANTCAAGKTCGHFTQLVWANTTQVGCGKATGNGQDIIVCNYNPPGNFVGEKPGASPAAAPVITLPTEEPTATPQVATTLPANTEPGAAIDFNTPNKVIPGSAVLWYKNIPAAAPGGSVTVRIPQGAANGLGFWIFQESQMADLGNETHIGTGDVDGNDLVWTSESFDQGPFFIVVFNNTIVDTPFTITVQ